MSAPALHAPAAAAARQGPLARLDDAVYEIEKVLTALSMGVMVLVVFVDVVHRRLTASDSRLAPGDYIELTVEDEGQGMNEETMQRIFDPFFTTKQAGHGMGLGLTICRRVVVAMGGTLALKSELGRGSEFTVRVPSAVGREAVG